MVSDVFFAMSNGNLFVDGSVHQDKKYFEENTICFESFKFAAGRVVVPLAGGPVSQPLF